MEFEFLQDVTEDRDMVRIIIGNAKTGQSGVKAPMKILTLINTNVEQIYEIVFDALDKLKRKKK